MKDIRNGMEDKIHDIVEEYGKEIIRDRKRFMSMVDDLCPQERLMRELLSVCLQTIPAEDLLEEMEYIEQVKIYAHTYDRGRLKKFVYGLLDVRGDITLVEAERVISILFSGMVGSLGQVPSSARGQNGLFIEEAAKQGHVNSQIYAAAGFEKGEGCFYRNTFEVVRWHEKLAKRGRVESQIALGLLLSSEESGKERYPEAFGWMKKAADRGSAEAAYHMGRFSAMGLGVEPNARKALTCYGIAAGKGHVEAIYWLGHAYQHGLGTDKNLKTAFGYYRKAAQMGHADAMFCVGKCFESGEGVDRNQNKAIAWYLEAARQGNPDAKRKALAYLN